MNEGDDATMTTTADDGVDLDPVAAAALLEQSTRRAESQFDIRPPLLMLAGAVVALIAYGSVWLSVRGQHPYSGPSGTALGVLYTTLVLWVITYSLVFRRATRGVTGRSKRQRQAEGATFGTIWISVYVFQGALHHAGAGAAIAYGIYPAVAPLIIVGSAAAAHEAANENWPWAAFATAAVALGAGASFAGPATVWAVVGIGLFILLACRTAIQVSQHRAQA
jgi:hypothetical protein